VTAQLDVLVAQSPAIEPEEFQSRLIAGMTRALLRDNHPPCLLRAPTGQVLISTVQGVARSKFENFSVSRDDVVSARLNKKRIEAVIYDLRQSVQTVADLQRTVLRQAWLRNQKLKRDLAAAGIPLVPLLLVQVANGEKSVEDAERELMQLCKVPPGAIGKHSAGTGFDAPRAFVLASTKPVNELREWLRTNRPTQEPLQ